MPHATSRPHPLSALKQDELEVVARLVKQHNPNKAVSFRRIYLQEPTKSLVVPYLEAELAGTALPPTPDRIGQALFYIKGEAPFLETLVNITTEEVISQRILKGMHGPGDNEEMELVGAAALASPLVKKELERLQLPEGAEVIAEPWPYGTDDQSAADDMQRAFQVWMFCNYKEEKDHPGANFYAHPLDFTAVVDNNMECIRIDRMPTTHDLEASTDPTTKYQVNPSCEYEPDLVGNLRTDLKPIHITQPEGVSFAIADDGETVEWQKWKFRICFDLREGMVLRNVCYDGRPVFYRLALSEMTVPYGDPRSPLQRKSAYDLGEAGAGQTANNLQLGCDCLGAISYISGFGCTPDGRPHELPNTICMHEQDAGIAWKHTNVRTGKAAVARARELILQLILTVGNYEYALYWIFDTAGALHWEVRATGIMSVTPVDLDIDPKQLDYGVVVAPGVFAPHHQHIFNIRCDPAIDGYHNSAIQYDDVVPMPRDDKNPHGVGFVSTSTRVATESAFDLDWTKNRTVKLINTKKFHPASKKNRAYKVGVPPTQLGLADPTAMHSIRGEFCDNHIFATRHADDEMYAAGEHPWQSVGGQGGCRTWANRGRPLNEEGGDGVLWITIGFTHVARPEDFPVMPAETFRMHFSPANFFDLNPALDLPPSTQKVNRSTLVPIKAGAEAGGCCSAK